MTEGAPLTRGITEVLLPSGWRVRGLLPTVGELLRRDMLPSDLIEVALRRADPAWLTEAVREPGQADRLRRHMALLVIAYATEQWDAAGDAWVPLALTPDDISTAGRLGTIDPDDVDALEALVNRSMTAGAISALSAVWALDRGIVAAATGTMTEVPGGAIPDWEEFRGQPGGGEGGEGGGEVGAAAEPAAVGA